MLSTSYAEEWRWQYNGGDFNEHRARYFDGRGDSLDYSIGLRRVTMENFLDKVAKLILKYEEELRNI